MLDRYGPSIDITGGDDADTLTTTSNAVVFSNDLISLSEIRHGSTASIRFDNAGPGDTVAALVGTVFVQGDDQNAIGPTVVVDSSAEAIFSGSEYLTALDVLPGGAARMAEDGTAVLQTNALSLSAAINGLNGGILDLADNDLIVHGGSVTSIAGWLKNGFGLGSWDDQFSISGAAAPAAIDSSTARQGNSAVESLGYAQVGTGSGQLSFSSFDNQSVNPGDVVVKFTYVGDTNLDGNVDSADENRINNGFNNTLTGWTNGDLNYDGSVDGGDYSYFDNLTNSLGDSGAGLTPGSMTLAADANFPVSGLPTVTPNNNDISGWRAKWGNGASQTFATGAAVVNPYGDMNGKYEVRLVALDGNGNPVYYFPHINVSALQAPPTDLTASAVSPNQINLVWSIAIPAPVDIYYSTDGSTFNYFDSVASGVTNYSAMGLTPGTPYTFEVFAHDTNWTPSASSNTALATTLIDPWNTQISGSSTVGEDDQYQLTLSTNPASGGPAFDHWLIDWGDGMADQVTTQDITVPHTFASGTSSATIQVTAVNADSSLSVTQVPINVDVVPLAPTDLVATMASSTEIDLVWTNNSQAATGINVLRSDDNGATFNVIDTVDADVSTYSDISLSASQTAQYKVQAIGGGGTTSDSGSSSQVTTPSGNPTFRVVANPNHQDSAVLSWGYQGNDDAGFEIEEEDLSIGENFHTILTPDPLSSGGSATTTVGITGGDSYMFRIRADHSDGTVSDYVSGAISIPLAPAPDFSVYVQTEDSFDTAVLTWSGALGGVSVQIQTNALPGGQFYGVSDNDDYYYPSDANGDGVITDPGNFGIYPIGLISYRVSSVDAYGNPTAWSDSQSVVITSPDLTPQPDSLQLTATDTSITATWPNNNNNSDKLLMNKDGSPNFVDPDLGVGTFATSDPVYDPGSNTFSSTMNNLQPGTKYDFVLWTVYADHYYTESNAAYTDESITTTGAAPVTPPTAPAFARAVYDPSVAGGQIKISWTNSSNNEYGFELRAYQIGVYTDLGSTSADETTKIFTPRNNLPYTIEVRAFNHAGSSGWTSVTVSDIGGPDITLHLLKINRSAIVMWNSYKPQEKAAFIQSFNSNVQSNWDISALAFDNVKTPHNTGVLPEGTATVTVDGHVYEDAIVDYWMYGIFARLAGVSRAQGLARIAGWRFVANPYQGKPVGDIGGRNAWFDAGYDGDITEPVSSCIRDVAPYPRPPTGDEFGPMRWYAGTMSGSD